MNNNHSYPNKGNTSCACVCCVEEKEVNGVWFRMQLQHVNQDIEFQNQIIDERESEIRQIEQGVTELNEIFRDLGTIINEQQTLLGSFPS